MRPISLEWIKNLKTDKERADFEEVLRANTMVTHRLLELCDEWLDEIAREECSINDFNTPNWDYKTACRIGDKARIRKVKDLLSFLKPRN